MRPRYKFSKKAKRKTVFFRLTAILSVMIFILTSLSCSFSRRLAPLIQSMAEAKAREQAAAARRGVTDRQVADEAMRKCAEEGIDPWTVTVPVRAKIRRDTNEKQYWGAVNGRTYAVPADDQYHEMKLPFALNLLDTMHVDRFVEKFAEKNIQMYDPKTNPKPED